MAVGILRGAGRNFHRNGGQLRPFVISCAHRLGTAGNSIVGIPGGVGGAVPMAIVGPFKQAMGKKS